MRRGVVSRQFQHLGAVRASLVLLLTAAGTFAALLLIVGDTAKPEASPVPHAVSALETRTPTSAAPAAARRKTTKKGAHGRPKEDSFTRLARLEARRARRQLREARKRTLGLPATAARPKRRAPQATPTANPTPSGTQPASTTTPPQKTPPASTTTAPQKAPPKQTKPSSSTTSPPSTGGTQAR